MHGCKDHTLRHPGLDVGLLCWSKSRSWIKLCWLSLQGYLPNQSSKMWSHMGKVSEQLINHSETFRWYGKHIWQRETAAWLMSTVCPLWWALLGGSQLSGGSLKLRLLLLGQCWSFWFGGSGIAQCVHFYWGPRPCWESQIQILCSLIYVWLILFT